MSDKKIEVVAIRNGYYKNRIVEVGEKFSVLPHELGTWMSVNGKPFKRGVKIEEPKVEKKVEEVVKAPAKSKAKKELSDLI